MDKNSGQNKKIVKKVNKVQMHIIYLFIGLLIFIIGVMARYVWVQIVRGDEMLSRLESQVQESSVLHVPRGTIYDAEMKELAISTMVSSLYIDPNHVEDPEQTTRDVAPLIGLTEKDILDGISHCPDKIIFLITHRKENLRYCNKIYQIRDKRMVSVKNVDELSK